MRRGFFNVKYADVLGIPFDFAAKPVVAPPQKPRETIHVKAVRPERDAFWRFDFRECWVTAWNFPEDRLTAHFNENHKFHLTPEHVGPTITNNSGIIGEDVNLTVEHLGDIRPSTVLYKLTAHLLTTIGASPVKRQSITSSVNSSASQRSGWIIGFL